MLAPSPDWFVGVDSLDMCDNGTWRESWDVTMLPPWDAGTEDGQQFSFSNPASNPHVNIFQITNNMNGAFKNDEPIKSLGEFLFKSNAVVATSVSFAVLVIATSIVAFFF